MRSLFITLVPGPRDPMRFSTLGLVCVAARTWGDAAPERGRHSVVTSPFFFGALRIASSRVVDAMASPPFVRSCCGGYGYSVLPVTGC